MRACLHLHASHLTAADGSIMQTSGPSGRSDLSIAFSEACVAPRAVSLQPSVTSGAVRRDTTRLRSDTLSNHSCQPIMHWEHLQWWIVIISSVPSFCFASSWYSHSLCLTLSHLLCVASFVSLFLSLLLVSALPLSQYVDLPDADFLFRGSTVKVLKALTIVIACVDSFQTVLPGENFNFASNFPQVQQYTIKAFPSQEAIIPSSSVAFSHGSIF